MQLPSQQPQRQSLGQDSQLSSSWQMLSPHWLQVPQSATHWSQASSGSQVPAPQLVQRSTAQVAQLSPKNGVQKVSPQVQLQSAAQEVQFSPGSHRPSPQAGQAPQSSTQVTLPPELGVGMLSVTMSYGAVTFPESGASTGELHRKADGLLYQAKERGRNRCCLWTRSGIVELHRSPPRT